MGTLRPGAVRREPPPRLALGPRSPRPRRAHAAAAAPAAPRTTSQTPIKVPAIEYVNYLMEWVDSQIETVFPKTPGEPFNDDFMSAAKTIFKRLFRV